MIFSASSIVFKFIKVLKHLKGLLQKAYTLDEVVAETKDLVAEFNPTEKTVILYMLKNFAQNVIKADGLSHPNEEKALKDWEEALM